jgi:RimJ/RimL family protein N-acetyltransferase
VDVPRASVADRADFVLRAVDGPTRIRLTERLRLEPITLDHADDLWTVHRDDVIAYWYGGAFSREQARDRARSFGEGWERDGVSKWIAHDRVDGTLIGRGGLSVITLEGERVVELGWAVRSLHQRRGYATEIGRAALAFAFEELGTERIIAFTEVHNRASRGVMERLGMHYVRDIAHEGLIEGKEGVHANAPFALYELLRAGYVSVHAGGAD